MLSLNSSLTDSLKFANTSAFWVLKLYYNDDSTSTNFIGVSDQHIVDNNGSDIYYGIVKNWGEYTQSIDFFSFTSTTGSMNVTLMNTPDTLQGGRFTDLFATKNFGNRKWELFLHTRTDQHETNILDSSDRLIGTGVISGDIKYNYADVKLTLINNDGTYHNQIPKNRITTANYPNAPEENIDKPIPMAYGDFSPDETAETYGTGANFDHYFTKGKFPAIITDKWNKTDAQVFAQPDSVVLFELDQDNMYMYLNNYYVQCNSTNVDVDASYAEHSKPRIDFSGTAWSMFIPYVVSDETSGMSDWANTVDNDLSTHGRVSEGAGGGTISGFWRSPQFDTDLGTVSTVKWVIFYKDFNVNADTNVTHFSVRDALTGSAQNLTWNAGGGANPYAETFTPSWYSTDDKANWSFSTPSKIELRFTHNSSDFAHYIDIYQTGIEINFNPNSRNFTKKIVDITEILPSPQATAVSPSHSYFQDERGMSISKNLTKKIKKTTTITTPDVGEYIYYSGQGREFGSWVDADSRNNGYNSGNLIPNPIYMIEDILRTELGATSTTIDYAGFDSAGNTTNGTVKLPFADSIGDIKFSFSQYKLINSKELIERIGRQCMTFTFLSADGKFKVKPLLLPGDTFTVDATINFFDIKFTCLGKTNINNVRNKVIINYAEDYGKDRMIKSVTETDATSAGTGATGNNDTLTLEMDADCIIDDTTATQLAKGYIQLFKDRKIVIEFEIVTPKYHYLEVTDYITFTNWDSNLKLYGASFNSDVFIITNISKSVDNLKIRAIKVDS